MIASFHLVQHRRRVVTPPRRLGGEIPGLRFWRPLNVGGDFAWFRQHPTRRALYPRLRPDFHRWGYYAVWEDEAHLGEFLAGSALGRAWRDSSVEAYHLWLRPLHVRGPWEGAQVLRGSETAAAPGRPVAHLVRLDLSLRGTLAMWGSAAPGVLKHLLDDDEVLLGLPLVDRPYTQPVSFTLWRTPDAVKTFAHREGGHGRAVRRVQRAQSDMLERYSSAGFDPYRCEGTWQGRDPLGILPRAA